MIAEPEIGLHDNINQIILCIYEIREYVVRRRYMTSDGL